MSIVKMLTAQNNELLVENFNLKYPVSTPVRYWPGAREGEPQVGLTRSVAQLLGGHTPVVWVTGHSGCIALAHVEALTDADTICELCDQGYKPCPSSVSDFMVHPDGPMGRAVCINPNARELWDSQD